MSVSRQRQRSACSSAPLLCSRYLFCVVTTVVFMEADASGPLGFFHVKGSRTTISDSSSLTTFTSRNRPTMKLEKQSRRSSLQRPEFLEKTRHHSVLVINKTGSFNSPLPRTSEQRSIRADSPVPGTAPFTHLPHDSHSCTEEGLSFYK